ncbi:MAG: glycosyltransferase [Candidatus Marinimicrobia bacterium]|nr:glycosyltransferase [Candidatus Neomarinimicrobiota bacterium]
MIDTSLTVGIPFHSKTLVSDLKEAIESIISQTLKADIIHLVQNGDISEEVDELLKSFMAEHQNIEHLLVEKSGLAAALNVSLRHTRTTYYARMDSDDISVRDRLFTQISFLREHPEIDIVGAWAWEFGSQEGLSKKRLKKMPTDPQKMQEWVHYRNPFIHPTVMYRVEFIRKLGYYNEVFLTDQDLELWGRAINNGAKIANIPTPLLYFRTDNMLSKRSKVDAVMRQIRARYVVRTWSPRLNILKVLALIFRLTPRIIREAGYKYLR